MSYPPEADMAPYDYLPTRTMTEDEAEWFAERYWLEHAEDDE